MTSDSERIATQYRTLFLLTEDGRIARENDPDHSAGARFWLAGCTSGNVYGVRTDVADDVASEIMTLAATEPPFFAPDALPKHHDRYMDLLSDSAAAPTPSLERTYELPHGLPCPDGVRLISGESPEGRKLHAALSADGMPEGLARMGLRVSADLWPPWCAAMHGDEIASIAFAARLSETGAELGLITVHAFRGRGYAAAATAGWSNLPSLKSRTLLYSTDRTNASSQRVAERLGLRCFSAGLRIS